MRGVVNIGGGAPSIHSKDLADYTIVYGSASTTDVSIVNYTGDGWLHSMSIFPEDEDAAARIEVEIKIDGVSKFNNNMALAGAGTYLNGENIVSPIYFSTSLEIKLRTTSSSVLAKAIVGYTKDGKSLPKIDKYLQGEYKFARSYVLASTDIINVSGSGEFRHVHVAPRYDTASDNIDITIIVDGVTKFNNVMGRIVSAGGGWHASLNMAIPFETSLQVTVDPNGSSTEAYCHYVLDN